MIDKIKTHSDKKTAYAKVGLQRLAWMLGMRQINMIEKDNENRRELVHYLVSRLTDAEIEEQVMLGKEFVCGYRPGVIKDGAIFDEVTSGAKFSDKNKALIKEVLVYGKSLKSLKLSGSEKQTIDQGCITVCRKIAPIESYRKTAARELFLAINSALDEKQFSYIVMSCLTGASIPTLMEYVDEESPKAPPFTFSAYCLLVKKAMDEKDYRELGLLVSSLSSSLHDLHKNCYFVGEGRKVDKIKNVIGLDFNILNLISLFDKQNKHSPKPSELWDLKVSIDAFYNKFKVSHMLKLGGCLVVSYNKVKDGILSGDLKLSVVSRSVGSVAGNQELAFFNAYNRWINRD